MDHGSRLMVHGSWTSRVDNRIKTKTFEGMEDNSNNEIWMILTHSNKDYEKVQQISNRSVLKSESGSFYVDKTGVMQRFEPAGDNPYIEEETEFNDNYTYTTHKSIRTMIMPNGVKGFVSDFMRGVRVTERFVLPEGLERIGNNSFDIDTEESCVFANCILPSVVIPQSVQEIGNFAFGHSHIESLQLPESLQSPYSRQFKDSYIGTLRLPKEWRDSVVLGEYNELLLQGQWFDNNKYGYLRWPSTTIGTLEFY